MTPRSPTRPAAAPVRRWRRLLGALLLAASGVAVVAAPPFDLPTFQTAAPNYTRFPQRVQIASSTVPTDNFRLGEEILWGVLAYLAPTSPVHNQTAYRDRMFLLMDNVAARWNNAASTADLDEIGFAWQMSYAHLLMRHHRPAEVSAERSAAYDAAIARSSAYILTVSNPLLYEQRVLANLWLNGDIRLAMSVYFGGVARGTVASLAEAEKARRAIDEVMSMASLEGGGQRYVGFWGEVSTYHEENVFCFIFWWLITGSAPIKAALDATVLYTPVAAEPNGFTEQASNIPYKHMYNNLIGRDAALWKAYLYDDGYNYFFGAPAETSSSTEILNAILYRPNRTTRIPPAHVGVFFDGNLQGPRGRFDGVWGWVGHGRNVQDGGPESQPMITAQALDGRQCGKDTLVGAFVMDATPPLVGNTPLKGALTALAPEIKQTAGAETDLFRGNRYRYLTHDERTRTITRRGFGSLSSRYRLSTRTSANASADWGSGLSWIGQQLWVMTGERIIGLVQITTDADSTVHGLDVRMILTGGRRTATSVLMGAYHELQALDATTYQFGQLRARVHATTFTGAVTSQRMAISDPASADDYSVLVRFNDATVNGDNPVLYPAGTRRWMIIEFVRPGAAFVSEALNVLAENSSRAALQFTEGTREIRIVQNLTTNPISYSGTFIGVPGYTATSLHRSWNDTVTALPLTGTTATVAETIPAWGHILAVNSNQPDDHTNDVLTANEIFGLYSNLLDYAVGPERTGPADAEPFTVSASGNRLRLAFNRRRADVTYLVEASGDLATWTVVATNPGLPGQAVAVDDTATFSAGSPRFMRLRVTRP